MSHTLLDQKYSDFAVHPWLQRVNICYIPGNVTDPLAETVIHKLLESFRRLGHTVQDYPDEGTNILITTAPYGKPLSWRESIQLTARRRYHLMHTPTVFTLVHIQPDELNRVLERFERILAKDVIDPADYSFPGLAENAYRVLYEQGRRGGAILFLERLLQAQTMCINILLLVGDEQPLGIYHFDLVGAHPFSDASVEESFYRDIVLRMVTRVSTHEITAHQPVGEPISQEVWKSLSTPGAMYRAAREFGRRGFFTEMVRIEDLVHVPAVADSVSSQYSEGCFATWDPQIDALIATITGSAHPVNKDEIGEEDLAVIVGVRPDREGALVRLVEGKANYPPSSEAVEMIDMDQDLPRIVLSDGTQKTAPVIRSKLHGHRGVSAYDPEYVEFVPLDLPYYNYPVTCATAAQADGIRRAFSRSQALLNPSDPRQLVFTVLPTHGVVIAEKWVPGSAPFQTIWEYLDLGRLTIDRRVPQGRFEFTPSSGKMVLKGI